ncbi:aminotransferase-like domain-containing protein [Microbacterium gorillae]|uniref:aminotransferase-like domain-containing protein n=1 Tax=Microbacterium gorillae TaxID=1231063 RepID=UPI0005911EDC|nr:PLP-dependent aminotransferase family protein [Microbacterium gorillae]
MSESSSERIEAALLAHIATAKPGSRLPSTRELTAGHGVSPVTVQKALRSLERRGLVVARPGSGVFVPAARAERPADFSWQTAALGASGALPATPVAALRLGSAEAVPLHSGYPDRALLPERLLRTGLVRAARSTATVERAPSAGLADLRAWFSAELAAQTPAGRTAPTARDVIVTPGSQLALGTVFRSIAGPGGVLLTESPTYWGAILAAAQVGVTLVPVPTDAAGPDITALDRAFAETGARGFYAQPTYANPTGVQWSANRTLEVLRSVRVHGAFLIEDDWAHDFGITTDPAPAAAQDDSGHVIYLRSLTKSVSAALRVAAIIARGPIRDRLLADVQAQAMYVSGVLQTAALEVVTQPAWRTHVSGLRRRLRERRDLLLDAVAAGLPAASVETVPAGGLNLWLRLPDETDLGRLVRDSEARGVIVAAGDEWFPAEPTGRFLRLNFAAADPASFLTAAEQIGAAWAEQQRAR